MAMHQKGSVTNTHGLLKELRHRRGWSRRLVSEKLGDDWSVSKVQRIETNQSTSLVDFLILVNLYGFDAMKIVGEYNNKCVELANRANQRV